LCEIGTLYTDSVHNGIRHTVMERRRQSQFNLTELNTAIDERASDAGFREASNVVEGDIGTAGIAGVPDVIAESPISISVPHQSSTRKRREVSSMSDRVNVESMGDSRQIPVNDRSSPPPLAWSGQVISDLTCQYLERENHYTRSQLMLVWLESITLYIQDP